jgi:RNA polymerase sigma-70 factor, ECF subfamily
VSSSFPATRFPALPLGKAKEAGEPTYKDTSAARPAGDPSDEALIARVCADDSEALGLLFSRYSRLVWSIARNILRNNEEADDLLQDVFLWLRRRASAFDSSKGTARKLIVHITYQRAISRRRYLSSRQFYAAKELEEENADHILAPAVALYDESLEAHLGREGLQKVLAELSAEQRETLRLCFFEGYTLEEIAVSLGQSRENVRHYYYRGLEKLRKRLKGNGL